MLSVLCGGTGWQISPSGTAARAFPIAVTTFNGWCSCLQVRFLHLFGGDFAYLSLIRGVYGPMFLLSSRVPHRETFRTAQDSCRREISQVKLPKLGSPEESVMLKNHWQVLKTMRCVRVNPVWFHHSSSRPSNEKFNLNRKRRSPSQKKKNKERRSL